MATGDSYTCTASSLHIRSGPGTSNKSIGMLRKGDTVTEVSTSNGWLEHSAGGWSSLTYLSKTASAPAPEPTVTTTTENTTPPVGDAFTSIADGDDEGSGYQPDIGLILSDKGKVNTYNSDFTRMSSVAGVFGLPYQFLPNTDPRINGSSTDRISIGYEYADKIVERIPLLFLTPGKASFMTHYSTNDKESILKRILTSGVNISGNLSTDDLLEDNGRYYTFEPDVPRYYSFVNPMCRIAARYLDIQDVPLDGVNLDRVNWMSMTKRRISGIGDFGDFNAIPFYLDTETSISESHSNSTTQSMIASTVNSISDMGRELNFLLGYGQSATGVEVLNSDAEIASNIENVQNMISGLMGRGNFLSNLANHLTTVAAGGKLTFPEIWSDSSFSRSYNCEFKFISPDPSNLSVYLNVLVPLFHLLGMVCPQSIAANPNGYTNPFLVRGLYKGFFNVDMGMITDMSVTKGAECQWTPEGIPTSMTVSITIKDLYQAMSITPTSSTSDWKYDTLNNTSLMDYIANLCGINIYKPEYTRMIEMWYMNNFANRASDLFKVDIWGGMQQWAQNKILGTFRFGR